MGADTAGVWTNHAGLNSVNSQYLVQRGFHLADGAVTRIDSGYFMAVSKCSIPRPGRQHDINDSIIVGVI